MGLSRSALITKVKVMNSAKLARIAMGVLATAGALSAVQISYVHITGIEDCPSIGPIPACYLVLAGYLAMLVATAAMQPKLFVAGLIPVLGLATMGVGAELLSDNPVCPQTADGIPKCYFSFGMAGVLTLLGWLVFRKPA